MKRLYWIFPAAVMALCFCVAVCAAGERELSPDDVYFAEENVELTAKEKNALAIARSWQQGDIMTENPILPCGAKYKIHPCTFPCRDTRYGDNSTFRIVP